MRAKQPAADPKSPLAPTVLLAGIPTTRGELDAEQVHRLRRGSKRVRAVLRLAEDANRPGARRARRQFAEAVRPFGVLRDAAVITHVAEKLALKLKGDAQVAARALASWPHARPHAKAWARDGRRVLQARRLIEKLDHRRLSPDELAAGLAHSARRAGKRARRAAKHPRALECAHAWRKAAVVLHDQLQAAISRPSRRCAKLIALLQEVTHEIGRAVDYSLFLAAVKRHAWPKAQRKCADLLIARAERKRTEALRCAHRKWPKAKRLMDSAVWKRSFGGNGAGDEPR